MGQARADRALVPSAVEELLRWTTPVISFMRTAVRDVELSGVPIGAGQHVLMLYASANRDEAVFGSDAEEVDVRERRTRISRSVLAHTSASAPPSRAWKRGSFSTSCSTASSHSNRPVHPSALTRP